MNKQSRIDIAQLGIGYWGPNILRVVVSLGSDFRVVGVVDPDEGRRKFIESTYPRIDTFPNADDLFSRKDFDAIIIATPAGSHFELALRALQAGKHVFVEKPLATSIQDAEQLVRTAEAAGLVLMVGHIFEFNSAVLKVEDLIRSQEIGDVYYVHGQRLNLGVVRSDVDALWNLAPHDISIVNRWMVDDPVTVMAQGVYRLQEDLADAVFLHLSYADGRVAQLHVSWLDPLKVRRMTVIGSKKMVVYDDTSTSEKVQIFDKGIDKQHIGRHLDGFSSFGEFQLIQRAGDLLIPKLAFPEPLVVEFRELASAIRDGRQPETDGRSGLRVVRCLEAASRSLVSGIAERIN